MVHGVECEFNHVTNGSGDGVGVEDQSSVTDVYFVNRSAAGGLCGGWRGGSGAATRAISTTVLSRSQGKESEKS